MCRELALTHCRNGGSAARTKLHHAAGVGHEFAVDGGRQPVVVGLVSRELRPVGRWFGLGLELPVGWSGRSRRGVEVDACRGGRKSRLVWRVFAAGLGEEELDCAGSSTDLEVGYSDCEGVMCTCA